MNRRYEIDPIKLMITAAIVTILAEIAFKLLKM
jgi:Tfp pilus assembly major pilin PilA